MEHNAQRLALMEEVAFTYSFTDYTALMLYAYPKDNQTLEEFTHHISETRSLRLLTDLSSKSHELKVKADWYIETSQGRPFTSY